MENGLGTRIDKGLGGSFCFLLLGDFTSGGDRTNDGESSLEQATGAATKPPQPRSSTGDLATHAGSSEQPTKPCMLLGRFLAQDEHLTNDALSL